VALNEPNHNERHDTTGRQLNSIEVTRAAKEYFAELTGKECERVAGLARNQDGWEVTLEVVELERIPETTDILGSYCVTLDLRGELMGYERVRRYCRCQPDESKTD
jgi:hypothetical protein